jgi:hypothetical protein
MESLRLQVVEDDIASLELMTEVLTYREANLVATLPVKIS